MGMKASNAIATFFKYFVLILVGLIMIYPLLWMISATFKEMCIRDRSSDPVTLTMSWWGGESRHNAYQEAIKAFSAEHSTITVNPTFCLLYTS